MQTTTPITDAKGARSYFEKDDYYTRDNSGGREWIGKGAQELGLTEVTPEAFQGVLEGMDAKGNQLVFAASNGEHRAGWDLHFAPSKSVSVVWAFGTEKQRLDMLACHRNAVDSVMQYVEDNLIEARITENNKTSRVTTGNMVAARFDHFTSREMDPQLHSHVVVANMTQRVGGQWRAIANEKIFNRELLTALYENELSAGLKERGYNTTMEKLDTGNSHYTRIEGIDERIIDHFGKRQSQIDQAIESLKEQYPQASRGDLRQMACLDTRQAKQTIDREVLHESWEKQLDGLGFSREGIAESITKEMLNTQAVKMDLPVSEYETVNAACTIINEQESTFSREDVIKTAARISGGNHRNIALERAFSELKGSSIVVLDKNAGVYTTKQMKKIEKGIVTSVREGQGTLPEILTPAQVESKITELYDHLTSDQQKALEHILTSRDRHTGIQGDAGTGKTSMLKGAREQLEGQGYTVRGLSFTGKAAKELQAGAGIESKTIHSFLPQIESPQFAFSAKETWFVDEVSMVGSKQMSELIKASKRANARLVFVGDTKQLQSIEAGKMFQKLQETGALKTVHMKETVRQKDEDYKAIVKDVSEKKIDSSFEKMTAKTKIKEITNDHERLDAIVNKVTSKKDYRGVLVVTPLNKDRKELNTNIRLNLKQKGVLNGQEHLFIVREHRSLPPSERYFADSYHVGDFVSTNGRIKGVKIGTEGHIVASDKQAQTVTLVTSDRRTVNINVAKDGERIKAFQEKSVPLMEGDKIVFLKNDRPLKVQNGLTAEIKKIDARGNITVSTDSKKDISFNINHSYNYLDHGYAVTDYKSQGQTSREVIFHANTEKINSYNSFYVAVTRGTENINVYTNDKEKLKEQVKKEVIKTSTLDHDKPQIQRIVPQIQQIRIEPKQINIPTGREGR
jgi:conjugative relaxase-like TrwC/TraI family protein